MTRALQPENVTGMRCTRCGAVYPPGEHPYVCPLHGHGDDYGTLDVEYDYERISRHISPQRLMESRVFSQWRYRPLLPVLPTTAAPPLSVGWTPLYHAERLGRELGLSSLYVKDDGREPTGALKDRASALAVMKARETGAPVITTASTGNAAAALAGMCAAVSMACVIFVPATAPRAKVAQLLAYGARVFLVECSYDQAFELCQEAAAAFGWYNRNTGYNPYMAEGKKTVAYEICEQLGWQCPDAVLVGVGDGCIISGVYKGFYDMQALGWIERMPRLIGVQSAKSDYMYRVWSEGADPLAYPPIAASTRADSISAGLPRDRAKALAAVTRTEGAFVRVADEAILAAVPELARLSGVFAEPAGAAPLAGLKAALGEELVGADETVVLLVTGNGLKDVEATITACEAGGIGAARIPPSLDALRAAWPEA